MAKLTYAQRKQLPNKDFAIPETRAYPLEDVSHAKNALARVSANGSNEEKWRVRQEVYARYPQLIPNRRIHGLTMTAKGKNTGEIIGKPDVIAFVKKANAEGRKVVLYYIGKSQTGKPIFRYQARGLRPSLKTIRAASIAELRRVHGRRSEKAQAIDEARSNATTIRSGDERVAGWKHDPGSADVSGIDTKGAKRAAGIEVEISDRGENHKLVKIIRNGRVYAATYAEPFPTAERAIQDYKANKRDFLPYNETTGSYIPEKTAKYPVPTSTMGPYRGIKGTPDRAMPGSQRGMSDEDKRRARHDERSEDKRINDAANNDIDEIIAAEQAAKRSKVEVSKVTGSFKNVVVKENGKPVVAVAELNPDNEGMRNAYLRTDASGKSSISNEPPNVHGDARVEAVLKREFPSEVSHGNVTLKKVTAKQNRHYSPQMREVMLTHKSKQSGTDLGAGVVRQGRRQHLKME